VADMMFQLNNLWTLPLQILLALLLLHATVGPAGTLAGVATMVLMMWAQMLVAMWGVADMMFQLNNLWTLPLQILLALLLLHATVGPAGTLAGVATMVLMMWAQMLVAMWGVADMMFQLNNLWTLPLQILLALLLLHATVGPAGTLAGVATMVLMMWAQMLVAMWGVADMMFQLNNLWTLPLQILLALLLLHATVGPAGTLAGVATMVLMMWAQLLVAGQARECQKERTAWQDLRLKATTEALNNMKLLVAGQARECQKERTAWQDLRLKATTEALNNMKLLVAGQARECQKERTAWQDLRLKATTEALNNMKVWDGRRKQVSRVGAWVCVQVAPDLVGKNEKVGALADEPEAAGTEGKDEEVGARAAAEGEEKDEKKGAGACGLVAAGAEGKNEQVGAGACVTAAAKVEKKEVQVGVGAYVTASAKVEKKEVQVGAGAYVTAAAKVEKKEVQVGAGACVTAAAKAEKKEVQVGAGACVTAAAKVEKKEVQGSRMAKQHVRKLRKEPPQMLGAKMVKEAVRGAETGVSSMKVEMVCDWGQGDLRVGGWEGPVWAKAQEREEAERENKEVGTWECLPAGEEVGHTTRDAMRPEGKEAVKTVRWSKRGIWEAEAMQPATQVLPGPAGMKGAENWVAWEGAKAVEYLDEEKTAAAEVIKLHAWEGRFLEQIKDYRAKEVACLHAELINLHAWEGWFLEQIEDYRAEEAAWLNVEVIKLHAWEGRFLEQIEDYRAEEAAWLARYNYLMAANIVFLWMSPLLVASATFAACVAFEEPLSAASIFTAIATFRILQVGVRSLAWLARYNYLMAANIVFLWMSPLLVASATFAACVAFEEPLSAASIFTAIATFRILQEPLRSFPDVLSSISQALVSLDRLARYQSAQEIEVTAVSWLSPEDTEDAVFVDGGAFTWDLPPPHLQHMHRPTLRGIGMQIGRGARVAICGPVGSGKSSLLSCILGEMHKLSGIVSVPWEGGHRHADRQGGESGYLWAGGVQVAGTIAHVPQTPWIQNGTIRDVQVAGTIAHVPQTPWIQNGTIRDVQVAGTIAHVPQTPWIQNGTIRDNVTFGLQMNRALYERVLRVCALAADLAVLPRGDETEIGERGINLSGGQKQRIQVARAVYHDADIYLLDDPFSSVDTATGSLIFDECVLGLLGAKTVLFVTNQLEFLPAADLILVMRDGEIVQAGQYEELQRAGTDFSLLLDAHNNAMGSMDLPPSNPFQPSHTSHHHLQPQRAPSLGNILAANGDVFSRFDMDDQELATLLLGPQAGPDGLGLASGGGSGGMGGPGMGAGDGLGGRASGVAADGSLVGVVGGAGGVVVGPMAAVAAAVASGAEDRQFGRVNAEVYRAYLTRAYGGSMVPIIVASQVNAEVYRAYLTRAYGGSMVPIIVASQVLQMGANWWLAREVQPLHPAVLTWPDVRAYASLGIGSGPFVVLRAFPFAYAALSSPFIPPSLPSLPPPPPPSPNSPPLPPTYPSQVLFQVLQIGANWWLAREVQPLHPAVLTWPDVRAYASLAIGSGLFVVLRAFLSVHVGLRTADGFFQDMLHAVFRAPMAFFDSTPTGRTLARASADQNALDLQLFFNFGSVLNNLVQLLGIFLVTSAVTWPVIVVLIPLALLYVPLQRYYLSSSRELTRIDGLTKSPILAHFSETLAGAAVIRAFAQEERFEIENADAVDNNMRAYFHYYGAIYWLGLRLETISAVVLAFVAFLLVLVPQGTIEPGLAGVSLAYGLTLNMALVMTMWHLSNLENKLVAVDRIRHFSAIPSEAPLIVEGNRPSADWPNRGSISFENLQMRYREAMPLVLKGVTVTFRGGEKVGVVGRTGSGKSTLVVALFRLVEPVGGRVMIDGVDISTIGLQDLRSRLAIIPQDPTLFEGTVRSNLDPLGRYHSSLLWEVLEKCQLAEAVMDKEDKLDAIVVEGGENWSVGQRQLFCLARALLKRSRILVLDEATASVDSATDAIIQRTIKENFARATVITVAHRIPSVIDSDKVLVLEADCLYLSSPLFTHLSPLLSLCLSLSLLAYRQQSPNTPATAFLTATAFANPPAVIEVIPAAIAQLVLPRIANSGELTKSPTMRNAAVLANAAILANSGVLAKLALLPPHPVNVSSWRNASPGVAERLIPLPRALSPAYLSGAKLLGQMNGPVNSFLGSRACSAAASIGHDASASVLDTEGSVSVTTIEAESPVTSTGASANVELTVTSMSGLLEEAGGRGKGRRGRPKGSGERGTGGEGGGKGTVKGKQLRLLLEEVGGEGLVGEGGEEEIGADGSVGKRFPDLELRTVGEGSIQSDSNGSSNNAVSEVVVVRRTRGRRKTAELTEKKEEGEMEGAKGGENLVAEAREEGREADSRMRTESPDSVLPTTTGGGNDSMLSDSNQSEIDGSEKPPQKSPTVDGGDSLLKFLLNLALEAVGGSDTEGERGPHVPAPTALDPMELRKRAWHADISQRHPKGAVILGVDPDVLGAVAVLFVRPRRKQEVESCAVSVVNTRSGQEEQGDGVEKVLHVRSCFEATQNATASEWEERLTVAAAEAWFRLPSHPLTLFSFPSLPPALLLPSPPPSCSSTGPFFSPHLLLPFSASLPLSTPITISVRLAYVEQARPFPSDGKQGWYGCGFGFGVWMGVLAASGFEVTAVTSVRWKAAIRSQASLAFTSKDSRQLALSLFPSLATQLKRKKDHGRAEALLIATYGTNLWPSSGEKSKKTRSRAKAATGEAVRTGGEGMEDGSSRMEVKEDSLPWSMPLPVI
ncbi:unnamed protein product, partial [Closterium sp. NIES-64]